MQRVATTLLLVVLPHALAQITPQDCMAGFLGMQFAFNNYDAYESYFHNESKMQLAQAGVYTGPKGIEEYVMFANLENPAIAANWVVNQTFALTGIGADMCEFFTNQYAYYGFNEIFSNGTVYVAAAFRMYLNLTSAKFDRINVFYETEYLHWFGSLTDYPAYQAYLCSTIESNCPSTWSFNNLSSQEDCVARLAALPTTTGEAASFDGNSQACRGLHGMLAALNPELHCPHISFAPQEDPNGNIKCQESSNVPATELFTSAQVALFQLFKAENGIPASGFIASMPCDIEAPVCPDGEVCVAGICADASTIADSTTSVSDTSSIAPDTSSTAAPDNSETDATSSVHTCTVVYLLALCCGTRFCIF